MLAVAAGVLLWLDTQDVVYAVGRVTSGAHKAVDTALAAHTCAVARIAHELGNMGHLGVVARPYVDMSSEVVVEEYRIAAAVPLEHADNLA